jgi:hypothetical protein
LKFLLFTYEKIKGKAMYIEQVYFCPPNHTISGQQVCCLGQQPASGGEEITVAASSTEVINNVLRLNPSVIAFGEIHPANDSYTPTITRFTREILPTLASHGIRDLILEAIPNDPALDIELASFYRTGLLSRRQTPQLWTSIQGIDREGYRQLLFTARQLGVRIHGGGASITQADTTIRRPDYLQRDDLQALAVRYIRDNTLNQANQLLDQGRRIAIYSGFLHNNLALSQEDISRGRSFGPQLAARAARDQGRYIEFDLILPYSFPNHYIDLPNWQELLPQRGVTSIRRGSSYTILYPSN